ncbi:MAG: hypothetical protein ACYSR9_06850 [Planctomycetota bacterium]|jgi:hypothetical protein
MKQGTRYPEKVMVFAVSRRLTGEKWKDVREAIRAEFGIEPPTERRMRDWVNNWGDASSIKAGKYLPFPKVPKRLENIFDKTNEVQQYIDVSARTMFSVMNAYQQRVEVKVAWALQLLYIMEETAGREFLLDAIGLYTGAAGSDKDMTPLNKVDKKIRDRQLRNIRRGLRHVRTHKKTVQK